MVKSAAPVPITAHCRHISVMTHERYRERYGCIVSAFECTVNGRADGTVFPGSFGRVVTERASGTH